MTKHVKMILLDAWNKYDARVRQMEQEIKDTEQELTNLRNGLQQIIQMRDEVKEELDNTGSE